VRAPGRRRIAPSAAATTEIVTAIGIAIVLKTREVHSPKEIEDHVE